MGKRLLLLSYYFPPGNIIGAVRPFQMASYFARLGWEVSVVSCRDAAVPDDFATDLTQFTVRRIEAPRLLAWLNAAPVVGKGLLGVWKALFLRGLRFVLRSLFFPEPFVLVRRAMQEAGERLLDETRFDLIISSALPFTVHLVARELAHRHAVLWVADNRDLWAISPYRRLVLPRRSLDSRFEREVLTDAALVLGVSEAMVDFYCQEYGLPFVLKVMNGFPATSACIVPQTGETALPVQLDIVYGGGLYGGLRDPSPLLAAIAADERLASRVQVSFYGSEPDRVAALAATYPSCRVVCHGRVNKAQIAECYRKASVLLVILGGSGFENGVMTGKFFEYLAFAKPVLAIAADGSELASVVNDAGVGLASREPSRIAVFLHQLLDGNRSLQVTPPEHLSIEYQLSRLLEAVERLQEGRRQ